MAKKKSKKSKSQESVPSKVTSIKQETVDSSAILTSALSSIQPVLMKVCRLCEAKDGPFLNIFEADKIIAKRIEDLMPFVIAENDDLPHKICFRCSAKVEELFDFVQKCIRTQESLRKALGKMGPLEVKSRSRIVWEEKLNQSNLTNDDICDALIKRAMEGIKTLPVKVTPSLPPPTPAAHSPAAAFSNAPASAPASKSRKRTAQTKVEDGESEADLSLQKIKDEQQRVLTTRTSRSTRADVPFDGSELLITAAGPRRGPGPAPAPAPANGSPALPALVPTHAKKSRSSRPETSKVKLVDLPANDLSPPPLVNPPAPAPSVPTSAPTSGTPPPAFDIMQHVCRIRVNGVGELFQCKLCNRNFLKREVVLGHGCARGGVRTPPAPAPAPPPAVAPPRSSVKYINTEPRPRPGPASRKASGPPPAPCLTLVPPPAPGPSLVPPSASAALPGRFKLVPGPDNTFTLLEESPPLPVPVSVAGPPETEPRPYPVGLVRCAVPAPRRAYSVLPTNNPSKLVISAKPPPHEDVVPLLSAEQYVLPTDDVIQESQISTSAARARAGAGAGAGTVAGPHSCDMCGATFPRLQRLHAHLQQHYRELEAQDEPPAAVAAARARAPSQRPRNKRSL